MSFPCKFKDSTGEWRETCGRSFTSKAEAKIHSWTHRKKLPKMRIGWRVRK